MRPQSNAGVRHLECPDAGCYAGTTGTRMSRQEETMKAAVMTAVGAPLTIEDVPEPEPGPTDAVIRVEACGICRSDWHLWQGDWTWVGVELPLPAVLGHEFGGRVVAVGAE